MTSPFFSIICPIYNKRDLIYIGINYILSQSFTNYEIILVDDGSVDGSEIICEDIASKEFRIKVMHQENKGSGSARNIGIKHSVGNYICFYDIDDVVGINWLETIYKLIKDKGPDLLVYSYLEINKKIGTVIKLTFPDIECRNNNEIREIYPEILSGLKFNNGFAWNKVYKRKFLLENNIFFPTLRIQQDEVFNHKVYKYANSLITSSKVLYDYYIYDKGNTRNSYIPKRLNIYEEVKDSFLNLSQHWQLNNPKLNYYIHSRLVKNCLYNRNPKSLESRSIFRKNLFINTYLRESAIYLIEHSKGLSKIERLYLKSIINKSIFLFSIAEIANLSISSTKVIYHKFKRSIHFSIFF